VAVLVTLSYLPPTAADIPNIQFIQFISAGINHVSHHPIYTDSDIVICSANGVHGPQIAEWVIMMDLVHHHGYIQLYEQQRAKVWKSNQNAKDRVGRTVGVLGYGSIGRQGKFLFRVCMHVLLSSYFPVYPGADECVSGKLYPGACSNKRSIIADLSGSAGRTLHFVSEDNCERGTSG